MISIFLASRLRSPKSGISSKPIEGRGFSPLSHTLPVLPLDGRIPLMIDYKYMLRGLRLVQGVSWSKSRSNIEWRVHGNFVDLVVQFKHKSLICLIAEETNFNELADMEFFKGFKFKYPKDLDPVLAVKQFLLIKDEAMTVEMRKDDEVFFLNNQAKEPSTGALLRVLTSKKGLYQMLNQEMDLGQKQSFLTRAYLKLQAEAFCRKNKYQSKSELTPAIREEILNHLCHKNESGEQAKIASLQITKQQKYQAIAQYESLIREVQANADRVLRLYQWGAIAATTVHLVGFGYMIFFVDWLGWDIIEPVTFSVSCLYLLMGLRFYRKFRRDRNDQTIRERFRELVLTPKKLMSLKSLHFQLSQQKESLKETEMQLILSRNRLAQSTTLNTAILQH